MFESYAIFTDPYDAVEWSMCTVHCGGGTRSRFISGLGGEGQEIQCNMQSCEGSKSTVSTQSTVTTRHGVEYIFMSTSTSIFLMDEYE